MARNKKVTSELSVVSNSDINDASEIAAIGGDMKKLLDEARRVKAEGWKLHGTPFVFNGQIKWMIYR